MEPEASLDAFYFARADGEKNDSLLNVTAFQCDLLCGCAVHPLQHKRHDDSLSHYFCAFASSVPFRLQR